MISIEEVIPSGSGSRLSGYFGFFMGCLGFALRCIGVTYPRISLTEMPLGAAESRAPELNGPVYAVPSPYTLAEVQVCLFYSGVELGL